VNADDYVALRRSLIRHEGVRLRPYLDTVGKLTIGVGRNLIDRGLSQDEAMLLLDHDIAIAVSDTFQLCPWAQTLDGVRQTVLIEMCFNLGAERLLGFEKMLTALRERNYLKAASEMLDSQWARQVGTRAHTLAGLMQTGQASETRG
jgi:lysozyme